VYIAGCEFEIPALPATDWIIGILGMDTDVLSLLLDLLPEDQSSHLTDLMLAGGIDLEELVLLVLEVVTKVGSRPWWVTMRLVSVAQENWHTIGAELMYRGIHAEAVSLAAWLDVFTLVLTRMIDPKQATMFFMKLEMPPPEYADQVTEESMEISAEAFMSMAG
jgi:hypothetical protein